MRWHRWEGTLLPVVRFLNGREEPILPEVFSADIQGQGKCSRLQVHPPLLPLALVSLGKLLRMQDQAALRCEVLGWFVDVYQQLRWSDDDTVTRADSRDRCASPGGDGYLLAPVVLIVNTDEGQSEQRRADAKAVSGRIPELHQPARMHDILEVGAAMQLRIRWKAGR